MALFTSAAIAEVDSDVESAWSVATLIKVKRKTKAEKQVGFALYTKAQKSYGVAFRCERKRLHAFFAMKPMNIGDRMFQNFRGPTRWQVWFSIDGGEEIQEEWVSIENGNLMMVIAKSTSLSMFEAARSGTIISVRPKNGKTVTLTLPPDTIDLFDNFAERCGLQAPKRRKETESSEIVSA